MKIIHKIICAILGHNYYTVVLNNFHNYGKSYFGVYHCQRCGHEESWQYDL